MRAALRVSLGCRNGDEGSSVARLERALRVLEGVGLCAVRVCGQVRILILLLSQSLFLSYHSTLLGAIPRSKRRQALVSTGAFLQIFPGKKGW